MKTPYQILGVSPDATDEEIKQAYRALAKKYHPDKYRDTDLAEMAEEKMKEVNAAYEEVQKIRAGKGSTSQQSGQGSHGSYNGYGAYGSYDANAPWNVQVRQLLNMRRLMDAERILSGVSESERNAEWNFLMGIVAVNRGFYVDAQHYFDTACGMDPDNAEYRNAKEQLRNRNGQFGGGAAMQSSSCSACDICAGMMCADCLCDLMRCC